MVRFSLVLLGGTHHVRFVHILFYVLSLITVMPHAQGCFYITWTEEERAQNPFGNIWTFPDPLERPWRHMTPSEVAKMRPLDKKDAYRNALNDGLNIGPTFIQEHQIQKKTASFYERARQLFGQGKNDDRDQLELEVARSLRQATQGEKRVLTVRLTALTLLGLMDLPDRMVSDLKHLGALESAVSQKVRIFYDFARSAYDIWAPKATTVPEAKEPPILRLTQSFLPAQIKKNKGGGSWSSFGSFHTCYFDHDGHVDDDTASLPSDLASMRSLATVTNWGSQGTESTTGQKRSRLDALGKDHVEDEN